MNSILQFLFLGIIIFGGSAILIDFASFRRRSFSDFQPIIKQPTDILKDLTKILTTAPTATSETSLGLKRILTFTVPSHFRSDDSAEVKATYYEAYTIRLLSGMGSFLYEKLSSFLKTDSNGLRGRIIYPVPGVLRKNFYLPSDVGLKLSSPQISIAPSDWILHKSGERIPSQWRWSLSSENLGKYHLVIEADQNLRKLVDNELLARPILFEVEVRSPYGLTLKQVDFIKSMFWVLTSICGALFAIALVVLEFPSIQTFLTSLFS